MRRLAQHFCASAFGLQHSRSFNAVKIIVLGSMNAMLDAVLRRDTRGEDGSRFASPVSLYMAGLAADDDGEGAKGTDANSRVHAVGAALFAIQCETLEVQVQELNVTRAGVLDYFAELVRRCRCPFVFVVVMSVVQDVSPERELFAWERDKYQMMPRAADVKFVKRIGHALCAKADHTSITGAFVCVVRRRAACADRATQARRQRW